MNDLIAALPAIQIFNTKSNPAGWVVLLID
jgi:hypothetical protein